MPHRSIVVLDDQPEITELVQMVLEPVGFSTRRCHTQREFWRAYEEVDPSVVIIDMIMPEHDGFEIVDELVKRDVEASVVVMSGGPGLYREAALKIGRSHGLAVSTTIRKPFPLRASATP